jgi:hypothetical protein
VKLINETFGILLQNRGWREEASPPGPPSSLKEARAKIILLQYAEHNLIKFNIYRAKTHRYSGKSI